MVNEDVSEGAVAPLAVCHDDEVAMSLLLARKTSRFPPAQVLLTNTTYVFRYSDVAFILLSGS